MDPSYSVLLENTPDDSTRGVCSTAPQTKNSNKLSKTAIILIAVLIPLAVVFLVIFFIVIFPRVRMYYQVHRKQRVMSKNLSEEGVKMDPPRQSEIVKMDEMQAHTAAGNFSVKW
eukprot:Phypoly_transcript_01704.p3 GENE.Phypoly_transcript_01704~~Phypoly_transcript_01704.p3  ORF type:complete len:115 (+),score=23.47 Phypoly_transcript_01704:2740-3084(+)